MTSRPLDLKTAGPLGLYIHIPFCKKKCNYCDFVSYAGKEGLV
ncbi:MAG: coproporphyrinogen III oxidase, partial [Candidatus Margulisiibacteriota bacterium]